MNGQFETQNPVENTVTPANQMETPTPEAPKKKGNKIAIIAGVVAAVVVVGGVGVFAAVKTGVFLSPSKKVLLAGAKTVSDMGSLGETLKDCVSLYSDEYTLKMDLSMNEGDISMEGRSSKEQKQIKGNLNISGAPSIDFLADKGYDSKYGARPLRRTIQTQIEDQLSEKILEGTIRKKTEVRIEKDGDQLKFETV